MFSTRIFFCVLLILISSCLPGGRISCQEISPTDTIDYLNPVYEGALDNNLMVAASNGLVSEIERLISKGADVNAESYQGATPLIFAVASNQLTAVTKLLEYAPDVNKMTENFETPLIISVKNRNAEIAEALIRGGADINMADKFGAAPLHYAALNGSFILADLLVYYDADCNKKANDGTTPLMAAIWSGYADITDLLFQSGANLEARDNSGFTPLLIASQLGDTLIMNLLLKEGVNIYEKNNFNYNALALAIESNQIAAVELLLKKGDKWTSPEYEGVNPYSVAYALGRKQIIEILEKNKIEGRTGFKIDQIATSVSLKFNNRDYYTGMSVSFKEPMLNGGFIAGMDLKPAYTRVLVKEENNVFYQFFDRSSVVFGGIFKDFTISEYLSDRKLMASACLSAGYSFGAKFRGTNRTPEEKIRIMPSAGLRFHMKHLMLKADLEFMNTGFYRAGPLWIRVSAAYNYYLSRTRSPGKTIRWQ